MCTGSSTCGRRKSTGNRWEPGRKRVQPPSAATGSSAESASGITKKPLVSKKSRCSCVMTRIGIVASCLLLLPTASCLLPAGLLPLALGEILDELAVDGLFGPIDAFGDGVI